MTNVNFGGVSWGSTINQTNTIQTLLNKFCKKNDPDNYKPLLNTHIKKLQDKWGKDGLNKVIDYITYTGSGDNCLSKLQASNIIMVLNTVANGGNPPSMNLINSYLYSEKGLKQKNIASLDFTKQAESGNIVDNNELNNYMKNNINLIPEETKTEEIKKTKRSDWTQSIFLKADAETILLSDDPVYRDARQGLEVSKEDIEKAYEKIDKQLSDQNSSNDKSPVKVPMKNKYLGRNGMTVAYAIIHPNGKLQIQIGASSKHKVVDFYRITANGSTSKRYSNGLETIKNTTYGTEQILGSIDATFKGVNKVTINGEDYTVKGINAETLKKRTLNALRTVPDSNNIWEANIFSEKFVSNATITFTNNQKKSFTASLQLRLDYSRQTGVFYLKTGIGRNKDAINGGLLKDYWIPTGNNFSKLLEQDCFKDCIK